MKEKPPKAKDIPRSKPTQARENKEKKSEPPNAVPLKDAYETALERARQIRKKYARENVPPEEETK